MKNLVKNIDKLLRETESPKLKEALKKRKEILENEKIVRKDGSNKRISE